MEQTPVISLPQYSQAAEVARHICERVATGAFDGLSLWDLCRKFAASETVLTTRFKRLHGVSIHAFIIQVKMAEARQRLATTEPIKAIAYSLGYSELANFSRDFKRFTGLSPQAYRRNLANGQFLTHSYVVGGKRT